MGALMRAAVAVAILVTRPAAAQELDRWRPYIAEASQRCGIPERWIVRVIRAESAGQAVADGRPIRSPKGAMGLMQLMPSTWTEMRAARGLGADPDDPLDNILAGTCYLRMMYDRYGYPGLFAAYNAGPRRYEQWLAGRPLPGETTAYVAKVAGGKRGPGTARSAPRQDVFSSSRDREKPAPDPLFAIRKDAGG